jgi:hypothetical protein
LLFTGRITSSQYNNSCILYKLQFRLALSSFYKLQFRLAGAGC